jgi:hypothetical protein
VLTVRFIGATRDAGIVYYWPIEAKAEDVRQHGLSVEEVGAAATGARAVLLGNRGLQTWVLRHTDRKGLGEANVDSPPEVWWGNPTAWRPERRAGQKYLQVLDPGNYGGRPHFPPDLVLEGSMYVPRESAKQEVGER